MHPGENKPNVEASVLGNKKRVRHGIVTIFEDDGTEESELPSLSKRNKSGTAS